MPPAGGLADAKGIIHTPSNRPGPGVWTFANNRAAFVGTFVGTFVAAFVAAFVATFVAKKQVVFGDAACFHSGQMLPHEEAVLEKRFWKE